MTQVSELTPAAAPWPRSARIIDSEFHLAGQSLTSLVQRWGTPAFFLDVADLRYRAGGFVEGFSRVGASLGIDTAVYYASKAFSSKAVLRMVHEEGLRVDVSTEGELRTALAAGIPGEDLGLHGNNKSDAELDLAREYRVGRIVADSLEEIDRLGRLAAESAATLPVMIRVTTGVHAGGHEFIATAHEDQKFGLSLASGAAATAIDRVLADPGLELVGLHSHIGSQILDLGGFTAAVERLLILRADVHRRTGYLVRELDIGGGYGISYLEHDQAPSAEQIAQVLLGEVSRISAELQQTPPQVSIEPGRSIVGPSMVTAYRVGTTKDVQVDETTTRRYISVDGGMSDNIRPALYGAEYTVILGNRSSSASPTTSRVVGKHCEAGDIVIQSAALPSDITRDDLLVVAATGAYCRSLASNYNMVARPPVIAVTEERQWEIVRRETIEDILSLDVG